MMIFVLKSCLFQNQTAWSTESKYSLWLIDLLTSYLMSKMSVSELLKNTKPWKTLLKTLLKGDSQNLRLIDGHFPTLCSHCFANYMNIFHKTEVQTVILRCWMVLYLNWFKSYLWQKTQIFISLSVSFNFGKKKLVICLMFFPFFTFFVFCISVITFETIKKQTHSAPQNDRLNFNFVKVIHVVGKKRPEVVVKWTFRPVANFGNHTLGYFFYF